MEKTFDFKKYYVSIDSDSYITYSLPTVSILHKFNSKNGEVYCLKDMLKAIVKAETELQSLRTVVNTRIATINQFSMFE